MIRRLLLALALAAALAPAARASVEEFWTVDVAALENDDENLFDHQLTRMPLAWRDEYDTTTNALRTSQGCYTAGQWFLSTDFKVRAPLGRTAYLDLQYLQRMDDLASYEWMRFEFRFPTRRLGTFGIRFQPAPEKSKQDFAALWDWGRPGGPLEIGAAFTVEDAFNSLWTFRQAQVNHHNEPLRAHPVEPALRVASRGRRHRVEVSGKWLTPLHADVRDGGAALDHSYALWGARGEALAVVLAGPWAFELNGENLQVRTRQTSALAPGDGHLYRRLWRAEGAVRRRVGSQWNAEVRAAYQDRAQDWRPPSWDGMFRGFDRAVSAEVTGPLHKDWNVRLGLMHDRVGVERRGAVPWFSWGTRKEARAYVGLEGRFGRVRIQGVEGIELDAEPYDVASHHDKGFLQLQTTF